MDWSLKLRRAFARCAYLSGVYESSPRGQAVILMYHRVLPSAVAESLNVQPGMYVDDGVFRTQVSYLAESFETLGLEALLERCSQGDLDPTKKYCTITFDDGWRDNYLYAFPTLRAYGAPATIFLVGDYLGTDRRFWFDRLSGALGRLRRLDRRQPLLESLGELFRAEGIEPARLRGWFSGWDRDPVLTADRVIGEFKKLPPETGEQLIGRMERLLGLPASAERALLNWEEIGEMARAKICFGSHSASHSILPGLTPERLREEIDRSFRLMQENRERNFIPVFAYPNGEFDERVARQVCASGFRAALTTRRGYVEKPMTHRYAVNRVGIHNDMTSSIPMFARRLGRR
ncbi:MAG: polysaccharide deacetylase family protein [bacterium]